MSRHSWLNVCRKYIKDYFANAGERKVTENIAMSDFNPEVNCENDNNNLQSDAGQLQLPIAVHLSRQTTDLKCPLAFAIDFREKNNVSEINGQIRHLCISDSDLINNIVTKISEQEDNFRVRRIVTDKVRWM